MSDQQEDPVAHATTKITSFVSVAALAAEALAQVAAARAAQRAAAEEQAAAAVRAQRQAAYEQARLGWAPILDPTLREKASVVDAGVAWSWAQAWRDQDPHAEAACQAAEQRLAELRPEVMDRYHRLCADGLAPVEAMRRVAPFFDRPPARPGQPGPHRAALADPATAVRAAAEPGRWRQATATGVDPRTAGINTHADAGEQAGPHLTRAAGQDSRTAPADATAGLGVDRRAVVLAAAGYPDRLDSVSLTAVRAALARPPAGTAAQQAPQMRAGRSR